MYVCICIYLQAYLQALQHAAFVGNRVPLTNSLPNEQDAAASLVIFFFANFLSFFYLANSLANEQDAAASLVIHSAV
jgi:hypothetical protein